MNKLFSQWVDDHRDQVWSLARYLLRDAAEAEDVTQEAYLRLWHHREALSEQAVRPWLLKVARNLCLDRLRRRPLEPFNEDDAVALTPGPLTSLSQAEQSRWLRLAIEELDEPFRSLVVLRDVQHKSYSEVAATTQLSLSQVKVYLHRARRRLREKLGELR